MFGSNQFLLSSGIPKHKHQIKIETTPSNICVSSQTSSHTYMYACIFFSKHSMWPWRLSPRGRTCAVQAFVRLSCCALHVGVGWLKLECCRRPMGLSHYQAQAMARLYEEQRYLIFAETRKRDQSTCRMFTVHGPTAVAMASVYILDSQAKLPDKAPDDWEDTPGSGCNIIGWMFLMYF